MICPLCQATQGQDLPFASRQRLGTFAIRRCDVCTHEYLVDPPSDAVLKSFYDDFFAHDCRYQVEPRADLRGRVLAHRLKRYLPAAARILDIGSNFGETLLSFPRAYELYGVELSTAAAETSRRVARLKIHNAAFEQVAFPDAFFDGILALAVIEHLREPRDFLARVAALLKPGGVAVIATGDAAAWHVRRVREGWPLYHADGHLHFFSARSLDCAAERAGLLPVDHIWAGPNPFSQWIPRWFARPFTCQSVALLCPWFFKRRPHGDLLYLFCRKSP